jgi:CDP-diacylglycerol--serine O-phosphatidyltransferase
LPVYSGKKVGMGVAPQMVLPVFVGVVAFFALLLSFPWEVLAVGTLCFLASLPFSWMAFQEYTRKDAEAVAAAHAAPPAPAISGEHPAVTPPSENPERPARLN